MKRLAGERFGRYRLVRLLGSGGMASVYLAEQLGIEQFSKRIALKIVHPHLTAEPGFTRSFIEEARLGGYLDHPNIVHTLDFGHVNGILYIAMEYVSGCTIRDLLNSVAASGQSIPIEIALELAIQLCNGLEAVHQQVDHDGKPLQLVHRDLKPSNLLLSRHGVLKIADFGVAKSKGQLTRQTSQGVVKGTWRYMSPEQARPGTELDRRSDLFAVGVILYELLTLRPLYDIEDEEELTETVQAAGVADRFALLPDAPGRTALGDVLTRALARMPEHRYASAEAMAQRLGEIRDALGHRTSLKEWMSSVDPALSSGSPEISDPPAPSPVDYADTGSEVELEDCLLSDGEGDSLRPGAFTDPRAEDASEWLIQEDSRVQTERTKRASGDPAESDPPVPPLGPEASSRVPPKAWVQWRQPLRWQHATIEPGEAAGPGPSSRGQRRLRAFFRTARIAASAVFLMALRNDSDGSLPYATPKPPDAAESTPAPTAESFREVPYPEVELGEPALEVNHSVMPVGSEPGGAVVAGTPGPATTAVDPTPAPDLPAPPAVTQGNSKTNGPNTLPATIARQPSTGQRHLPVKTSNGLVARSGAAQEGEPSPRSVALKRQIDNATSSGTPAPTAADMTPPPPVHLYLNSIAEVKLTVDGDPVPYSLLTREYQVLPGRHHIVYDFGGQDVRTYDLEAAAGETWRCRPLKDRPEVECRSSSHDTADP